MALAGIHIVELAGLAPGPFAGMVLSDFGASVIRVDKLTASVPPDMLCRQAFAVGLIAERLPFALDLKSPTGITVLKKLLSKADVLIDPFRPGVLESLGLAPNELQKLNPRLIIARLTGFGQSGPFSKFAGHDINYIALSGVLSLFGPSDQPPMFPSNLLGDFAGGALFCVLGILLALLERQRSGTGQIIDAAMVDGALYLSTFITRMKQARLWNAARGKNMLDGGAPFYKIYQTRDDKFIAVGAIEPQFYKNFIKGLGLDIRQLPFQMNTKSWPELELIFSQTLKQKTRDEWMNIFEKTDACVTPVLEIHELSSHPQHQHRQSLVGVDPVPCPRLDKTPAKMSAFQLLKPGQHTKEILQGLGMSQDILGDKGVKAKL